MRRPQAELTNFRTPMTLVFLALKTALQKFPPPRTPEMDAAARAFVKAEIDRLRAERSA